MAALGCPHVSSPPPAPTEQVTRSQAPLQEHAHRSEHVCGTVRCMCAQSQLCWGVPGSHDSAIAHLQNPVGYAPWVAVGQADAKTPQSRCSAEPHSSKLVVMELVDKEQNGREFLLKKISHLHEHEQCLDNSMNAMSAPVLCHPCILISCSINAPHAWQGQT